MYNHSAFGVKLKSLRIANNLSQNDLSLKTEQIAKENGNPDMKVSQTYISDLEKGTGSGISLDRLCCLSLALNVTMDDLISDSLASIDVPTDEYSLRIYEKLLTFNDAKINSFIKLLDYLHKYKTGEYINNINTK